MRVYTVTLLTYVNKLASCFCSGFTVRQSFFFSGYYKYKHAQATCYQHSPPHADMISLYAQYRLLVAQLKASTMLIIAT